MENLAGATVGNQRPYQRDMARRIAFIQAGQRVGISLADIKATLDQLPNDRTPTADDWAAISQGWTTLLNERIRRLEAMRDKLTSCIQCGCLSLENCQIYNPDDHTARSSKYHNALEP